MNKSSDEDLINQVFDVMPNFPERESNLLKHLRKVLEEAWSESKKNAQRELNSRPRSALFYVLIRAR
jgi:hypothetical protein